MFFENKHSPGVKFDVCFEFLSHIVTNPFLNKIWLFKSWNLVFSEFIMQALAAIFYWPFSKDIVI